MDAIITILIIIVRTQNINWFLRLDARKQEIFLTLAEVSFNDKICLQIHGMLGMILPDEQLKQLKIVDNLNVFYFKMLEQAWQHPSKKYKHIQIFNMLRGQCCQSLFY